MIQTIQYILYAVLIIACVCSVFFSFKSRRSLDPKVRGLSAAKTNISMGVTLIILALIQMFMFSGSSLRVVIGALFMVLGAFNIFAGIRNHGIFSRQKAE
ncbi:MAG: YtpI family protein [Paenibacillus macerans]|uniref:YtpI-like family protein n=1 Tax=Paenibacillus macerans TaxID=44252 RepID=A0A090Y3W5_PAEMA|nr:YtpI family protein [Paenibacillus macerans]KFM93099.1 ytpI-like family protein [Paenibacillus macerans]MBS5912449.1 hypothetical protein [Paenibacillus macerans]MCY7559246.1 YtpI family protein [Paenibacillus macerans]MDU7475447.1 YtpI family protein [Paenibacillus macerans]MEC0140844.1 YtpI family protein [Paenibacillus macerans]